MVCFMIDETLTFHSYLNYHRRIHSIDYFKITKNHERVIVLRDFV
jgi:hypothetical protein